MDNIVEYKLRNYIEAVKKSLNDRNWTSALAISLMLPDMCSGLEYTDIKYVGDRYRKWFEEYLYEEYNNWQPMMSAHDFYALRCSYIHGGETDINQNKQRKVVSEFKFIAPQITQNQFSGSHRIKINDYLILRVDLFCMEICDAVMKWVSNNEGSERVKIAVSKIIEINDDPIYYNGVHVQ